jgi:hypothetical protein
MVINAILPTSLWWKSDNNFSHLCAGKINKLALIFGLFHLSVPRYRFTVLNNGEYGFSLGFGGQGLEDSSNFRLTG